MKRSFSFVRRAFATAAALLLSAVAATVLAAQDAAGGEAALKMPDLSSVTLPRHAGARAAHATG